MPLSAAFTEVPSGTAILIPSLPPGLNPWMMRPRAGQRNSGVAVSEAMAVCCGSVAAAGAGSRVVALVSLGILARAVSCFAAGAVGFRAAAVLIAGARVLPGFKLSAWLANVRGRPPATFAGAAGFPGAELAATRAPLEAAKAALYTGITMWVPGRTCDAEARPLVRTSASTGMP